MGRLGRIRSLRGMALGIAVSAVLCAAHTAVFALDVNATLDKQKAVIGEPVVYSLVISGQEGLQVQAPELRENIANFTIVDFDRREKKERSAYTIILDYTLKSYHTGEQEISPIILSYRRSADAPWLQTQTQALRLTVESVLEPEEAQRALRDIKGPVGVSRHQAWLAAVLALVIAAGAWFWWRRAVLCRAHARTDTPAQPIPAHQIAFAELDALRNKEYIRQGLIKQYFIEISGIVRRYLENRFSLHAPEMTTEEFLDQVRQRSVLAGEHKQLLKEFLEHSDLVKFARYAANSAECDAVFEAAMRFVRQTRQEDHDLS